MSQNKFLNFVVNKNLFIVSVFLLFFILGTQIYDDYGFYIDEKFHRANGFYWLNYIANFFAFESLSQSTGIKLESINGFTLPDIAEFNAYGVIFDLPAAYLEIKLNLDDPLTYYKLRHFLVFVIFFIGSIFFYKLILNRFENRLVSVLGIVLFILTPRIFGDSFWNNKDIVFLSLYLVSIFFYFELINKQSIKNIILFSLFAALSTSVRFAGIFLPISLLFFFIIDKLSGRKDLNFKTILLSIISFLFILFVTWPFLWNNFFDGILSSLSMEMTWEGKINFLGKYYMSSNLPYYYLVFWIFISTPLVHLILFIFGFTNYLRRAILRFFSVKAQSFHNDLWRSKNEKKDFLIFINLIFFMSILSFLNMNLYNGWRLAYFLYIFIIYFSIYGIYILIIKNKKKIKIIVSVSLILISFLVYRISLYHPYQSLYFNFLVPSSIKDNVDVDYTGLSGFHFLKYIIKNEKNFPVKIAVNSWYPLWRMNELLRDEEKKKIKILSHDKKFEVDYLYSNRIYDVDKRFYKKYDIPSNFEKFFEYKIDNTIIYEIYKRSKK